jgi:WD40 repeat protein
MLRLASPFLLLLYFATGLPAADPTDWKSVVDPQTNKIDWPKDFKLDAAVPKSFFDPGLTFAEQGPFAICGTNGQPAEYRAVIDLRTGKETAKLTGQHQISAPEALSHDGTLFATCSKTSSGEEVAVYDLGSNGRIIAHIPFPGKASPFPGQGRPDTIRFIGNDRLLLSFGKTTVQVNDIKTGKVIAETKTENSPWRHALPIPTPGGKYFVVPDNKSLSFHEVADGKEVASLPLTTFGQGQNFDAIAVSPDGTRLAALMESFQKRRLVVVDLATGKTTTDVAIEGGGNAFYSGSKLVWAADNSGLLYWGMAMIDPVTGKTIFSLPGGAGTPAPGFPISLGAVVKLVSVSGDRRLQALTLSSDKLEATKAAVKSGGTAVDALLPPVLNAIATGAKEVFVPLARQNWIVKSDPEPKGFEYDRPIPIDFALGGLQSIRICGGTNPTAVYDIASVNVFQQPEHTQPRTLKKVDLRTGRSTSYELPPGCAVVDLAADGSAVVTIDAQTGIRSDVHSLTGGKPIGFKPYDKEVGEARKVAFAYLLEPNRLLTVSATGTMGAWDLASGKAIFVARIPDFIPVTLTAGRKYICGTQNGMIRFFDTASGEPTGDLAPSFVAQTGHSVQWGVAVKRDGTEATGVFTKPGAGQFITRFDLKTGKTIDELPLTTFYPDWPKPEYVGNALLFNGRDLYDPAHKAVVWRYATPWVTIAAQRPDGQLWYGVGGQNNSTLVATTLPSEAVTAMVREVADGPGSIIKPGVKVALALDFSGSNAADARKKVIDAMTKSWADRGITVKDKADVMVQVMAIERDTGKKMEFTSVFRPAMARPGGRPVDSARIMEVTIETAILVNGKPVWTAPKVTHNNRPPIGVFTVPKEEPSVESYLLHRMWDGVPSVTTSNLPEYLTKTPTGIKSLPGSSQLTASGIVDSK